VTHQPVSKTHRAQKRSDQQIIPTQGFALKKPGLNTHVSQKISDWQCPLKAITETEPKYSRCLSTKNVDVGK